jgi:hypothetical protein
MPRYYKYGYQGPQYAGQWSHQIPTPQTQAPGLRYGLGEEASDIVAKFESPFAEAPGDLSKLSDKELDILIDFSKDALAAPGPDATKASLAIGQALVAKLEEETIY